MNKQDELIQAQIDNLNADTAVLRAQVDSINAAAALTLSQAEELNIKNTALAREHPRVDPVGPAKKRKRGGKKK